MALSRTAPTVMLPHSRLNRPIHSPTFCASAPSSSRNMLPPLAAPALGAHFKAPGARATLSVATATAVPASLASVVSAPLDACFGLPQPVPVPAPAATPRAVASHSHTPSSGPSTPESPLATPSDTQVYGSSPPPAHLTRPHFQSTAPEPRGRTMVHNTSHARGRDPDRFSHSPTSAHTPRTTASLAPIGISSISPARTSSRSSAVPSTPHWGQEPILSVSGFGWDGEDMFEMDMDATPAPQATTLPQLSSRRSHAHAVRASPAPVLAGTAPDRKQTAPVRRTMRFAMHVPAPAPKRTQAAQMATPVRLTPPIPPSHRDAEPAEEPPQRGRGRERERGRGRSTACKVPSPEQDTDLFPVPALYQSGW